MESRWFAILPNGSRQYSAASSADRQCTGQAATVRLEKQSLATEFFLFLEIASRATANLPLVAASCSV